MRRRSRPPWRRVPQTVVPGLFPRYMSVWEQLGNKIIQTNQSPTLSVPNVPAVPMTFNSGGAYQLPIRCEFAEDHLAPLVYLSLNERGPQGEDVAALFGVLRTVVDALDSRNGVRKRLLDCV